jgi:hypothetical protein
MPEQSSTEVVEMPLERLEAEICELAAHQSAAECRLLVMVEEFNRREGWVGWGLRSCAHWLSWKCGLGLGAAREKVRVARRLAEMPLVRAAFSRGELSYSKVRALARAVTPDTEELLLEFARHAATAQLELIVRRYRDCVGREELDQDRDREERRTGHWYWDNDGSLVVNARFGPEEGAVVVAALEAQRTALIADRNAAGTPPGDGQAAGADVLVALARTALSVQGEGHATLPAVVIHVDAAALPGGHGRCHVENGPALPPETARRLACDAALVAVVKDVHGNPLDIGRRSQSIPPAIRRALWTRDGGCRFPGCGARRFVAGHHIIHWDQGGPTAIGNLVLLCNAHHRLVHERGYGVTTPEPHEFVFTRPDGTPIPAAPGLPAVHGPRQPGPAVTRTTLDSLAGKYEPFDLGLAVEVILHRAGLLKPSTIPTTTAA